MTTHLNTTRRLRLIPVPPFKPDPCRLYGPREAPHLFVTTELVVRDSRGNVTKRLVPIPGGWREVAA